MITIFCGIDPGLGGALAFLDVESGNVSVEDCPVIDGEIDTHEIVEIFKDVLLKEKEIFVTIEKSQPMPKQGVSSVFKYGKGYGEYRGILASLGIPFVETSPQSWKKAFGLLHCEKEKSILKAKELFPCLANEFKKKKDHGRAEALLLALYGRRKNT